MKTAILFPGQGSQYRGMGKHLFETYPVKVQQASDVLGYDLIELCLHDPERQLNQTQFTQPALYVVNALAYEQKCVSDNFQPDFALGHSLGEYNALLAAGVYDFITGLKLVQKRGQLMAEAASGSMVAIIGLTAEGIRAALDDACLSGIEIANYNTPTQLVISGPSQAISQAVLILKTEAKNVVPLPVSAAFHSSYMKPVQEEFAKFLDKFDFNLPKFPIIANSTAKPYDQNKIKTTLNQQIASSVRWVDSIRYLMGQKEDIHYVEINSQILTKMVVEIKENTTPIIDNAPTEQIPTPSDIHLGGRKIKAESLGSVTFRKRYGIRYAYLTGAMYKGIASKQLVIAMAKTGLLSFFGTGGLSLSDIESNISAIQAAVGSKDAYGMNLLCNLDDPKFEEKIVDLYLKYHICHVEAAAYMQITPALVRFRLTGLSQNSRDDIQCKHHVIAKCSRPEVAEAFMNPAPQQIVNKLLANGLITPQQAKLSQSIPMSADICVEADSGGHTDGGIPTVLLPAILSLRETVHKKHQYAMPIHIGLAGGIGTPESAAAAFIMGADFILTGSINHCTVEAGNSDVVKDMLQDINVQDTDYAPAGDMFEIGAKIQVLKRGTLFPTRANKLYQLYTQYSSLDEIPEKIKKQLQERYFKKTFDEIWQETKSYFQQMDMAYQVTCAESSPKRKMGLIFRWYFGHTTRAALAGDETHRVDFQVHIGPALGAFNQWVKGTELESWRKRHVDLVAHKLMRETAELLERRYYQQTTAALL